MSPPAEFFGCLAPQFSGRTRLPTIPGPDLEERVLLASKRGGNQCSYIMIAVLGKRHGRAWLSPMAPLPAKQVIRVRSSDAAGRLGHLQEPVKPTGKSGPVHDGKVDCLAKAQGDKLCRRPGCTCGRSSRDLRKEAQPGAAIESNMAIGWSRVTGGWFSSLEDGAAPRPRTEELGGSKASAVCNIAEISRGMQGEEVRYRGSCKIRFSVATVSLKIAVVKDEGRLQVLPPITRRRGGGNL